jgi:hypothetical protein
MPAGTGKSASKTGLAVTIEGTNALQSTPRSSAVTEKQDSSLVIMICTLRLYGVGNIYDMIVHVSFKEMAEDL